MAWRARAWLWGCMGLLLLWMLPVAHAHTSPQAEQRATLPPTWTPTPTFTPLPTRTASPTPTITPTLTRDELCAALFVLPESANGRTYTATDTLALYVGQTPPQTTLRVLFTHRQSGQGLLIDDITLPDFSLISVPMLDLPRTGLYTWAIELRAADTVLCEQRGFFRNGAPQVMLTLPPAWNIRTPTPSATPQVIVVTATPTPTPQ